jgi:hypothetical protein
MLKPFSEIPLLHSKNFFLEVRRYVNLKLCLVLRISFARSHKWDATAGIRCMALPRV